MFDRPDELLDKIRLGEDSELELKAVRLSGQRMSGPSRAELADELAAFGNFVSGVVVLGVDDRSRSVEGIPIERLDLVESVVREVCNDSISPPLPVRITRMTLPDETGISRPVLKIDVPRSLFLHKSPGGYLYRLGSSKREMATDMLLRLGQQRSQARIIRFDEQPVPGARPDVLEESLWRRFLRGDDDDPVRTLRKLRLVVDDDAGEERASVAAVLLCCQEPTRFLPNALVAAVHYRGTAQDSNYQQDAEEFSGPLDRQIFDALAWVRRNMSVAASKSPARHDHPEFADRAVFEALVNAVAHRDYSIYGSRVRLFLFDDRLELYSPGPPPNSIALDSLALRQATRNELITSLLARCPVEDANGGLGRGAIMDRRGEGVPIILSETRALTEREPEYRLIDQTELLLTIWSAPSTPELIASS